ncbi:alpha/beta hydrolase [Hymenobacter sp. 15J16-1T3B]|uniref:alpha/beta fold hydrolase n=1 Tax=Hymenobacter sp. 15J16-1T3B TaxID=2886941 RepID=UPI001D1042D9|nr:alpha/beta hydrolase [Hymenobacter sp. 15J16-1T3B]MCC3158128.1 alpha/beta hydrolase [Hymenobacter sp. 15J16-1T3B]
MLYSLEDHYVETNGLRLHVVQCGPLDGPLVVLLHGFPEFWYGWHRQIPALAAAGYRVWAPDQRGYNLSDKPRAVNAYAVEELVADVIGLLDAAGREQACVVGHDWGGIVAWHLAARHPARLRRVAILNVPHPTVFGRTLRRSGRQRRKSWYALFFQLPWLPEQLARLRNWWAGRKSLTSTSRRGTFSADDLRRYRLAWSQPGAMRSMINWYRAAARRGRSSTQLGRITVPLQLIWGRRDAFLEARMAEESQKYCDQGWLTYFDKATHWVQHEEGTRVNELLLEFFAEAGQGRGNFEA